MKKQIASVLLLSATAVFAGQAFAADGAGMTRAQVLAELAQAQKDGSIVVGGESGMTAKELRPDLYPSQAAAGKSRTQVLAELAQAQRDGTAFVTGEANLEAKQTAPVVAKSRAQVQAELKDTGTKLLVGELDR